MQCTRCQGLMVADHLVDLRESNKSIWLHIWRCMNCGEVVDPHIVERRALIRSAGRSPTPAPERRRRRGHVAVRLES